MIPKDQTRDRSQYHQYQQHLSSSGSQSRFEPTRSYTAFQPSQGFHPSNPQGFHPNNPQGFHPNNPMFHQQGVLSVPSRGAMNFALNPTADVQLFKSSDTFSSTGTSQPPSLPSSKRSSGRSVETKNEETDLLREAASSHQLFTRRAISMHGKQKFNGSKQKDLSPTDASNKSRFAFARDAKSPSRDLSIHDRMFVPTRPNRSLNATPTLITTPTTSSPLTAPDLFSDTKISNSMDLIQEFQDFTLKERNSISKADLNPEEIDPDLKSPVEVREKRCFREYNRLSKKKILENASTEELRQFIREHRNVIETCVEDEEWKLVVELFRPMCALIVLINSKGVDFCIPVDTVDSVVSAWSNISEPEKGLEILEEVLKINGNASTTTVELLMKGMMRAKKTDIALEIFESSYPSTPRNDEMYRIALLANFSDWKEAKRLFEEMMGGNIRPSVVTYTVLINIFHKAGKWKLAIDIFDEMQLENVKPNATTFSLAISSCIRLNDRFRALDMLEKARESGIILNACIFTSAICACEKARDWKLALDFLGQMERGQIQTNEIPYNAAIATMRRAGRAEEAFHVFERMQQARVKPDTVTYNTLLSTCERSGEKQRALRLHREMQRAGVVPDTITMNSLISCCGRAGDWKMALKLFDSMKELGLKRDEITYTSAITACGKSGRWEKALALFGEMELLGLPRSVISYTATINACEKSRRWQEALEIFNLTKNDPSVTPNVQTYTTAISACAHGKRWREALSLLDEMTAAGLNPNQITYGMAIRACTSAGKWDSVAAILHVMKAEGIRHGTFSYSELVAACTSCGNYSRTIDLYMQMIEEGVTPNRRVFASVLTAASKTNQVQLVKQIVRKIEELGIRSFHHPCLSSSGDSSHSNMSRRGRGGGVNRTRFGNNKGGYRRGGGQARSGKRGYRRS